MVNYRFELTGSGDKGDFAKVQDAFRDAVLELRKAGVTVGGSFSGSDSFVADSGITLIAGDVEEDLSEREKAIRERHADEHKAAEKETAEREKEAKAEKKRQDEARTARTTRSTGDTGAGEVKTGDRGATDVRTGDRGAPVSADPTLTAGIEQGATKASGSKASSSK